MLFLTSTILFLLPFASAAVLQSRTLSANDVIIYGKSGRVEIISKETFLNMTTLPPRPPSPLLDTNTTVSSKKSLSKRCKKRTIIYERPTEYFLNWDVPMSSVVQAPPTTKPRIAVTAGYSISNSISVSVGLDLTLVKDFLGYSYSIDYSQTWTSEYSATYNFEVPEGKIAAVVSNPTTTRHSGTVWTGCIGEQGTSKSYMADSYESRAYSGLSWVDGVIGLCLGDSFPLMRCLGEGRL